jgi:hypothetical protein
VGPWGPIEERAMHRDRRSSRAVFEGKPTGVPMLHPADSANAGLT